MIFFKTVAIFLILLAPSSEPFSMHENSASLFYPACNEDFLWLPHLTHQASIWPNRVTPRHVRWRAMGPSNKTAALCRSSRCSFSSGTQWIGSTGRPVSGCRTESDRWPSDTQQQMFPPREAGADAHTLSILVCIWLTRMPPHRHKCLVFISLWWLLSASNLLTQIKWGSNEVK